MLLQLKFTVYYSVIVHSCNVHPCDFPRYCPLLHCPLLQFQRPISLCNSSNCDKFNKVSSASGRRSLQTHTSGPTEDTAVGPYSCPPALNNLPPPISVSRHLRRGEFFNDKLIARWKNFEISVSIWRSYRQIVANFFDWQLAIAWYSVPPCS